jgi:hypothetical protein
VGECLVLSVEEYITRRKREDKLNEFDIKAKMDNIRICVNYIFEYFDQYLNIDEIDQKTLLNQERVEKYKKQFTQYSGKVQEWLINIFDTYNKRIHQSIGMFLKKDELFYLRYTENDFRTISYECYAAIIKKNPFIKDDTELLFDFIKEYHELQSQKNLVVYDIRLNNKIDNWIKQTQKRYHVNIWAFVKDYINHFYSNDNLWPARHKIKNDQEWQPYIYDYRQRYNLFGLDTLYPRISNRPFMKRKKQYLEILMMYVWLHDIWGDEDNYWEEYKNKTISD